MFHEPFLGTLPFSIDLYYFAHWLKRDRRQQHDVEASLPEGLDTMIAAKSSTHQAHTTLLVESAASEFRMF